jgi:hypothetical protein
MIAIWSRAARTPGTCRCITCATSSAAVARRAGAAGIRRSWLGIPTSTFVYTAVFTAGLAIDAKSKRNRNEQWETAFEQLRGEMSRAPSRNYTNGPNEKVKKKSRTETIEDLLSKDVDWDMIQRLAGMELTEDEIFDNRQFEADVDHIPESLWNLLAYDSRLPDVSRQAPEWPANTGPDLIPHYLPPQSLWSPEHLRWTAIRRRQTWKKLAIQELSVGLLIHSLLAHTKVSELPEEAFAPLSTHIQSISLLSQNENQAARLKIKNDIAMMANMPIDCSPDEIYNAKVQTNGPAIPVYHQDSDGDFYSITQQMNTAIQNLIMNVKNDPKHRRGESLRLVTAKICHNLLVSSAAPDVQTINILLTGYKKRSQPKIVNSIIAAFYACKIRPNEITCATILDHYVQWNQPDRFSNFVAQMRGLKNALMLARPDITINEVGESRLIRVADNKVYQKVYPTPVVFNALMLGVLKFAGFERAVDIYFEMKEDGWGLDTLGLSHYLKDCVGRADWNGGLIIWQEIASIKHKIKPAHMANAYANMLSLASVTGNTVAYNQLLTDIVRKGYDRQRIMEQVMMTTRDVSEYQNNTAPAWTADNLLIAVSDYLDHKPSSNEEVVPESAFEEGVDEAFWARNPTPSDVSDLHDSARNDTMPDQDPDEIWQAWMQHELGVGEPMVQKPTPKPTPEPVVEEPKSDGKRTSKSRDKQQRSRNGDRFPD